MSTEIGQVTNRIDKLVSKTISATKELVKIQTTNPPGSMYRECVGFLKRKLKEIGFKTRIVRVESNLPDRYVLIGYTVPGTSRLHFNCHYDVVPPGVGWKFSPFKPSTRNGRIYGRGTADMKGAIASILTAFTAISDVGDLGELTISFVPDEETGGLTGTAYLLKKRLIRTRMAIMPEPSGVNNIWNSSKGALWLSITVRGRQSHSTLPSMGLNSFEGMVEIASELRKLRARIESRVSSQKSYPKGGERASLNLGGTCSSGEGLNTKPGQASFTIDRRTLPEESIAEAEEEVMRRVEHFTRFNPGFRISVKDILKAKPFSVPRDHPLCRTLSTAIRKVTGRTPRFTMCPGIGDARYFNQAGIPCVFYGPGSLRIAHAVNEYVRIDHLTVAAKVYAHVIAAREMGSRSGEVNLQVD